MKNTFENNTAFRELGFIKEESKEIVDQLNVLLANYQIHYQKLRNFHWNVKGSDFFDIHNEFEDEYNHVKLFVDEIAERIRTFGATPLSSLKDYLEVANIEEASTDLSSDKMVEEIIKDYTALMGYTVEVVEKANENGDLSTSDIMIKNLKRMEKRHWMFTSFLNK